MKIGMYLKNDGAALKARLIESGHEVVDIDVKANPFTIKDDIRRIVRQHGIEGIVTDSPAGRFGELVAAPVKRVNESDLLEPVPVADTGDKAPLHTLMHDGTDSDIDEDGSHDVAPPSKKRTRKRK